MRTDPLLARRRTIPASCQKFVLAAVVVAMTTGCVGTLANLVHVAKGNTVPAKFTGLKGKRVAVVCVANSESFGPSYASQSLASQIGKLIAAEVSDVKVIAPQTIANWIDRNNWNQLDFQAVGQGVNADMVIAVDLDSFNLHDGKTLYKGRAEVGVVVYDLQQGGREVFAYNPTEIQYPENSGYHTTDMSEETFRRQFLSVVASRIARQFYAYDAKEDYARDTSLIQRS